MTATETAAAARVGGGEELRIGAWILDAHHNELRRDGESTRLEPKAIEVLAHLARHAGTAVSREELLTAVWPGVVVGDDALTQAIIKLRKALGDDAHKPTYIETISKRGYRLIAPVEPLAREGAVPGAGAARRLAAILSADIAGYSRLMQDDEAETVKALKEHQAAVLPLVASFEGRVIDLAGDGILAEFPSAVGAVNCALEIQRAMAQANAAVPKSRRLQFRIGVNLGDVIHDGERIYGDGINIAARIQALAPTGGLIVSQTVFEQVRNKVAERFAPLGAVNLKNIREPVMVYQAALPSGSRTPAWLERWRFTLRTRKGTAVALAGTLVIVGVVAIPIATKSIRMPWPLASDTRGTTTGLPTVAVLPLANLSGDPKREYFSDGMTEDMINALGRFSSMRVLSRSAVQAFKGTPVTPQAIRKEMDVRYLVQGSVRDADGRIRVVIELSDTENGALLWSEKYEGGGAQVFDIQDRIVRDIVGKLHVRLTHLEEARARALPTESLEAHDLVLRARFLLNRAERSANREARALLARAMQIAPDYPQVYTAMSAAEFQRATDGFVEDAEEATRRAEEFAKRTLAFADERAHAGAHSQLAAIYAHLNRPEEALAHADRAIELNPSDIGALYWRGAALLYVGRMDEAISVLETARRYEPYPAAGRALNLSLAYYVVGRYADTLAHTDALLARNPRNVYLHAMRAAALGQLGKLDEAARAADDVRRFNPAFQPDNFGSRFADPRYTALVRDGLRKAGL